MPALDANTLTILIGAVVAAGIAWMVARGKAKQTDIETLRGGYDQLKDTTLKENERLNNANIAKDNKIAALELRMTADKADCVRQIGELQAQLTVLMNKLPVPGATVPVVIKGVEPEVEVPVVVKGPIPLLTAQAKLEQAQEEVKEAQAAVQDAQGKDDKKP